MMFYNTQIETIIMFNNIKMCSFAKQELWYILSLKKCKQ